MSSKKASTSPHAVLEEATIMKDLRECTREANTVSHTNSGVFLVPYSWGIDIERMQGYTSSWTSMSNSHWSFLVIPSRTSPSISEEDLRRQANNRNRPSEGSLVPNITLEFAEKILSTAFVQQTSFEFSST